MPESTDVQAMRSATVDGTAQPSKRRATTPAVELALLALAHAVPLVAIWLVGGADHWRPTRDGFQLLAPAAVVAITLEGILDALAYVAFRTVARREQHPLELFTRCLCATWLWGLLAVASAVAIIWAAQVAVLAAALCLLLPVYLIAGPALFARSALRPQRISRWRPVCPECGYSLRRAAGPSCSECGTAFPAQGRWYRRWAVQRLRWDRPLRGSVPIAYMRSVLTIVFRPWRAGAAIAVSDRWPRAVRWAVFHLVIFSLAATLAGSQLYFLEGCARLAGVAPPRPWIFLYPDPSAALMLTWATQSFLAHLLGLALLPVTACMVAMAMPQCSAAARRTMVKWSLYAIVAIYLGALLWYPCQLHFGGSAGVLLPGLAGQIFSVWRPNGATTPPAGLVAAVYGLWWAAGVSANPYVRRRGWRTLVLYLGSFMGLWLLLARVLFPMGPLEWLK
jgi:hypothetical protein